MKRRSVLMLTVLLAAASGAVTTAVAQQPPKPPAQQKQQQQKPQHSPEFADFLAQIKAYAKTSGNVDVVLKKDLVITSTVDIPTPEARIDTLGARIFVQRVRADTLFIRSANPARPVTLMRGTYDCLFDVASGATLVLENIIVDGDSKGNFAVNSREFDFGEMGKEIKIASEMLGIKGGESTNTGIALVIVGRPVELPYSIGNDNTRAMSGEHAPGVFIMNDGAVLRNNIGGGVHALGGYYRTNSGYGYRYGMGTFIMKGGKISGNSRKGGDAGGVKIEGGKFFMHGGEISGNIAANTRGAVFDGEQSPDNGGFGGGVGLFRGGGILSKDTTSGSRFYMSGGKISGNTAGLGGGGVFVASGIFSMTGGEISGNTAGRNGGGGALIESKFTMAGGKISGNTAGGDGGGVNMGAGTFTMDSGEISGNTAGGANGGGVAFMDAFGEITQVIAGKFTMTGGEIKNNTAGNGGGVYFRAGTAQSEPNTKIKGSITMTGGKISGNTAAADGGGVMSMGAAFDMSDGEISGNTAGANGGGVLVSVSVFSKYTGIGKFTMSHGTIDGNSAADGGGAYVHGVAFTLSGGRIVGNAGGGVVVKNIKENDQAGAFTMTGGVVAGAGAGADAVVSGKYSLNAAAPRTAPNNGLIIAWNKPAGSGPFTYAEGAANDLTVLPATGEASAVWTVKGGKLGISYKNSYKNGAKNADFIEITKAGRLHIPHARYVPLTPKLTVNRHPTGGGTVTPESGLRHKANTPVNITAVPASGYVFLNWTVTGSDAEIAKANSAITTVVFTEDAAVTANFQKITEGAFADSKSGETFRTQKIGDLTWMTENLNVAIDGSRCYGDDPANCGKYGRLYTWDAAMKACPDGWRLSTRKDWENLVKATGGNDKTGGKKLKSAEGWENRPGAINGTDDFGFTAIPGGYRDDKGKHRDSGEKGCWWTAGEASDKRNAWYRYMWLYSDEVDQSYQKKTYEYSVRCVLETDSKSAATGIILNADVTVTASFKKVGLTSGILVDSRDGKEYRTVKIGDKTWMAENLNFTTQRSWCHKDEASDCEKYGRMYTWNYATVACPPGWRLPDDKDWEELVQIAGGLDTAGRKLKSKTGWRNDGNGTDDLGFTALPGGEFVHYSIPSGGFANHRTEDGFCGYWWSNTRDRDATGLMARRWFMKSSSVQMGKSVVTVNFGSSVRCVCDD